MKREKKREKHIGLCAPHTSTYWYVPLVGSHNLVRLAHPDGTNLAICFKAAHAVNLTV